MIALLASPWVRGLIIALAIVAFLSAIRYEARLDERQKCQADTLRAELAEVNRRLEAAEQVAKDTKAVAGRHSAELGKLRGLVDEYEELLSKRDDADVCRLTDDDVKRLRDIR